MEFKTLMPLDLELPLKVMKVEVFYWKVDHPELCTVGSNSRTMGVFSQSLEKSISCYGIPCFEYSGLVKVSSTICNHDFRMLLKKYSLIKNSSVIVMTVLLETINV